MLRTSDQHVKGEVMATLKKSTHLRHRIVPYQFAAAVAMALAFTFAAGAATVLAYPGPEAEPARPGLPNVVVSPFEYFPAKYENQATEIEPMPPTF
jgi:hypothetical protein